MEEREDVSMCNDTQESTHNDAGGLLLRLHRALELKSLLRQHVDLGRVVRWRERAHVAVALLGAPAVK